MGRKSRKRRSKAKAKAMPVAPPRVLAPRTPGYKPKRRAHGPTPLHKVISRGIRRHAKYLMTRENLASVYRFFNANDFTMDNTKRGLEDAIEYNYGVQLRP